MLRSFLRHPEKEKKYNFSPRGTQNWICALRHIPEKCNHVNLKCISDDMAIVDMSVRII